MSEHWTEKYRPRSLDAIVGNEAAVEEMRRWAESWAKGKPRSKAIVLRGEPGIGKTSSALALANDFEWDFIEMNASDHRNASSIRKIAGIGAISQTFSPSGEFMSSSEGRRKLIVIDEADNLFGREDFGGAKAIVETIRDAAQPIVLIVNDYYQLSRKASAIKSLARSVSFDKPGKQEVIRLLEDIARREGLVAERPVLERIAQNAGGDLRAAINDLQMLFEGRSALVGEDVDALGKRNQEVEVKAALNAVFSAKTAKEAVEATYDLDKTPEELEKWIEDSITVEFRHPEDMASAFDMLSRSNIYLARTRRLQHYGLWGYARELMTGGVSLSRTHGARVQRWDYRLPSHFIVMSRAKANRSARASIVSKLVPYLHTSGRAVNESTLPYLSVMVRNDEELLIKLVSEIGLAEEDLSYLLGVPPSSERIRQAIERASPSQSAEDEGSAKGGRTGRSGPRKKGLGDF